MDITREEAKDALEQVNDTAARTRRMMAGCGADLLFMVWGIVWMLGYAGTHLLAETTLSFGALTCPRPDLIGWLWGIVLAVGFAASAYIGRTQMPVKSKMDFRIGIVIFLLFLYVDLWIGLLFPFLSVNGHDQSQMFWKHMGAIAATVPMFGYVVSGILLDHFMVWLGLAVTALTIAGLLLFPQWFWLWMAAAGGGSLLATGLWIRVRWS